MGNVEWGMGWILILTQEAERLRSRGAVTSLCLCASVFNFHLAAGVSDFSRKERKERGMKFMSLGAGELDRAHK